MCAAFDVVSFSHDLIFVRVFVNVQCRLEANYAHQQELDMIPLMMQKKYKPQGWRKSQHSALRLCLLQHRHAVDMGCFCW